MALLRASGSEDSDNVRDLQSERSRVAKHLLAWFHVTMRITMLRQQLKELVARAPTHDLTKLDPEFERIKWMRRGTSVEVNVGGGIAPAEAAPKTTSPASKIPLRPWRSPSAPAGNNNPANTSA